MLKYEVYVEDNNGVSAFVMPAYMGDGEWTAANQPEAHPASTARV